MRNIAIFGCGAAGHRARLLLKSKYRITAFLDNDRRKHGSQHFGVPVRDPDGFDYNQVDHVFIASMYYEQILLQLMSLHVLPSKIECVTDEMLGRNPRSASPYYEVFTAIRRLSYLPFRLLR
jgi:hypothetical protein